MSTIGLYICEVFSDFRYHIAKSLKNISIVEMHHLKIFGQLADQLGESPPVDTSAKSHVLLDSRIYQLFTDLPKILLQCVKW